MPVAEDEAGWAAEVKMSRSLPFADRPLLPPMPRPASERNELRCERETGVPVVGDEAGDDEGEAIRARSGDGGW